MLINGEQVAAEADRHLQTFANGLPNFVVTVLGEDGTNALIAHSANDRHIEQLLGGIAGQMHGKEPDNPFKNRMEASANLLVQPEIVDFFVGSGLWVEIDGYPSVEEYDLSKSYGQNITGTADYKAPISPDAHSADFTLDTGAQLRGLDARLRKLGDSWERGLRATGVMLSGMREVNEREYEAYDWDRIVSSERAGDEFNAIMSMSRAILELGDVTYLYDSSDTMIAAQMSDGERTLIVANGPLTTGQALNRAANTPAPRAPLSLKMLVDNDVIPNDSVVAFGGTVPHAPSRQHYEAATVLHGSKNKYKLVRGVTGIPSAEATTASLVAGELAGVARNTTRALFTFAAGEFADNTLRSQIAEKIKQGPSELDRELSKVWGKRVHQSINLYIDSEV